MQLHSQQASIAASSRSCTGLVDAGIAIARSRLNLITTAATMAMIAWHTTEPKRGAVVPVSQTPGLLPAVKPLVDMLRWLHSCDERVRAAGARGADMAGTARLRLGTCAKHPQLQPGHARRCTAAA